MQELKFRTMGVAMFCLLAVSTGSAQKLKSVAAFNFADGSNPQYGSLLEMGGSFYGTTQMGGNIGLGTVYGVTPQGELTTIYSFGQQPNLRDGAIPDGGLVARQGILYGTTAGGGVFGSGTVFQLTLDGTLTTIHSFDFADGSYPVGGLVYFQGALYGATQNGGATNQGTIYQITLPDMTFNILYSFCPDSGCLGGHLVWSSLTATKHELWGVASLGGVKGFGTVFRISPSGAFQAVHSFDAVKGASPFGSLLYASDGKLYGTTATGGAHNNGTIFELTTDGHFNTLYSFCAEVLCPDGAIPQGSLYEAKDGSFYGTTYGGGPSGFGTIFEVTPSGQLTTLHAFKGFLGAYPLAGVVQGSNGAFYGTTSAGGGNTACPQAPVGCGAVFALFK